MAMHCLMLQYALILSDMIVVPARIPYHSKVVYTDRLLIRKRYLDDSEASSMTDFEKVIISGH